MCNRKEGGWGRACGPERAGTNPSQAQSQPGCDSKKKSRSGPEEALSLVTSHYASLQSRLGEIGLAATCVRAKLGGK